jgi:hypothetical protein
LFSLPTPSSAAKNKSSVSWQQDSIILYHPIKEVEAMAVQCGKYDVLFPNVTKVRKLSRNQCYLEAHIMWAGMKFGKFWMKIEVGKRSVDQDGKTFRFKVHKRAGNVDLFAAEAKLIEIEPKKTKLVLRMLADPGLTGVPDSIIESETRYVMKEFMVNLGVELMLKRF